MTALFMQQLIPMSETELAGKRHCKAWYGAQAGLEENSTVNVPNIVVAMV